MDDFINLTEDFDWENIKLITHLGVKANFIIDPRLPFLFLSFFLKVVPIEGQQA